MKKIGWLLITLVILMFSTSCGNEQKQLKIIEQTESTTVCEFTFDFKYETSLQTITDDTVILKVFDKENKQFTIDRIQYFSYEIVPHRPGHFSPMNHYPGDKIRIYIDNRIRDEEVKGELVQSIYSKPYKVELLCMNPSNPFGDPISKPYYF